MLCARYLRPHERSTAASTGCSSAATGGLERGLPAGARAGACATGPRWSRSPLAAVVGGVVVARRRPGRLHDRRRTAASSTSGSSCRSAAPSTQTRRVDARPSRRAATACPRSRPCSRRSARAQRSASTRPQIYVQLVHKSQRESQPAGDHGRRARARSQALDLPLADFAVEEIGFIQHRRARATRELMYSIRGPDIDRLQFYARDASSSACGEAGGYADVYLSYETGKPEIALEITRERAADLGVPALQIGQHHLGALRGLQGDDLRGGRRALRRARAGAARVPRRPRQARARARARRERRAGAAAQPRDAAHRQRPGADRPREPQPRPSRSTATSTARRRARPTPRSMRFAAELDIARRVRVRGRRPLEAAARDHRRDRLRLRAGAARDLHDPRVAVQLLRAPVHDHALGAALVHRRLRRRRAAGLPARRAWARSPS